MFEFLIACCIALAVFCFYKALQIALPFSITPQDRSRAARDLGQLILILADLGEDWQINDTPDYLSFKHDVLPKSVRLPKRCLHDIVYDGHGFGRILNARIAWRLFSIKSMVSEKKRHDELQAVLSRAKDWLTAKGY